MGVRERRDRPGPDRLVQGADADRGRQWPVAARGHKSTCPHSEMNPRSAAVTTTMAWKATRWGFVDLVRRSSGDHDDDDGLEGRATGSRTKGLCHRTVPRVYAPQSHSEPEVGRDCMTGKLRYSLRTCLDRGGPRRVQYDAKRSSFFGPEPIMRDPIDWIFACACLWQAGGETNRLIRACVASDSAAVASESNGPDEPVGDRDAGDIAACAVPRGHVPPVRPRTVIRVAT